MEPVNGQYQMTRRRGCAEMMTRSKRKLMQHTNLTNLPEFAQIMVQQLGGLGKLQSMISATLFVYDQETLSLSFRFKGSRNANYFKITLNSSNLYDLEFWQIPSTGQSAKGAEPTLTYKTDDIYYDSLIDVFERVTELRLSLTSK